MTFEQKIQILQIVVTCLATILASSGFWLYLDKFRGRGTLQRQLLIGLAHDRIIFLAMRYIERGWITQDEHENLTVFLYHPYQLMGGNGSARRLIDEVNKLPIVVQTFDPDKKGGKNETKRQSL